jgi:hypothetical protein
MTVNSLQAWDIVCPSRGCDTGLSGLVSPIPSLL